MAISSILLLICSNAVTLRRDKSILYARIVITILVSSLLITLTSYYVEFLDQGLEVFGGLYQNTAITHIARKINNVQIKNLDLNINSIKLTSSLTIIISFLTLIILFFIFIPQEWLNMANILALNLYKKISMKNYYLLYKYYSSYILNKILKQFRIIKYSLEKQPKNLKLKPKLSGLHYLIIYLIKNIKNIWYKKWTHFCVWLIFFIFRSVLKHFALSFRLPIILLVSAILFIVPIIYCRLGLQGKPLEFKLWHFIFSFTTILLWWLICYTDIFSINLYDYFIIVYFFTLFIDMLKELSTINQFPRRMINRPVPSNDHSLPSKSLKNNLTASMDGTGNTGNTSNTGNTGNTGNRGNRGPFYTTPKSGLYSDSSEPRTYSRSQISIENWPRTWFWYIYVFTFDIDHRIADREMIEAKRLSDALSKLKDSEHYDKTLDSIFGDYKAINSVGHLAMLSDKYDRSMTIDRRWNPEKIVNTERFREILHLEISKLNNSIFNTQQTTIKYRMNSVYDSPYIKMRLGQLTMLNYRQQGFSSVIGKTMSSDDNNLLKEQAWAIKHPSLNKIDRNSLVDLPTRLALKKEVQLLEDKVNGKANIEKENGLLEQLRLSVQDSRFKRKFTQDINSEQIGSSSKKPKPS